MRAMLALATPLILLATPALAQPRETVRVAVSLKDLNLATPEGQRAARLRVRRAAIVLCGVDATRNLAELSDANRCQAEALASGRAATARMIAAATGADQVAAR